MSQTLNSSLAPLVVSVAPGSPAELVGIMEGDEIIRVNGQVPRDIIEWQMSTDEADVELDVLRGGLDLSMSIEKIEGSPLGIEISSAVFDRVRTCDNHCEFCFIYQLPKGMRRSLYLKDDDYRLSFLYGNFTTLTRFTEADLERVVTERLSPLHVSIHSTDPDVRSHMLKNPRGAMSLRWLRALLDHDITVKGQVVVCPGVNDGAILDDTMAGILDQYPELESVAVVPLGISKFNGEAAMRFHTLEEARSVVDTVADWQDIFQATLGKRMVYAADEYYLMAQRPFPEAERYDDFAMHEDGIGMARTFEAEFHGLTDTATGVQRGFFAAVDAPPNPAAYTALRQTGCGPAAVSAAEVAAPTATGVQLRPRKSAPVGVLTGSLGAPVITPLIESLGRDDVRVLTVQNEFFGGNTGVTGLMTGDDVARVLNGEPEGHRYLIPDVCLSDEGRFLDGITIDELPRPVEVIATDGLALRAALEGTR
ncbi:MAG: putative radical SAM enzyme (TIGR03279 family) [Ilumatobacter sp.]|jgi:putative radical SAM enzyme (TIGR03279 family)